MPARKRLTEAATLTDVKARDFVSWASSSGTAKGRVRSVHKGKVPAVPVKVVGTVLEPAARVELYTETDGGWKPTGQYVGLTAGKLTPIEDLPEPAEPATEADPVTEAVVARFLRRHPPPGPGRDRGPPRSHARRVRRAARR